MALSIKQEQSKSVSQPSSANVSLELFDMTFIKFAVGIHQAENIGIKCFLQGHNNVAT